MKKRVRLMILFFSVTSLLSAQLNVKPIGRVDVRNQMGIYSNTNNVTDGVDIVGNNPSLDNGIDLIWCMYNYAQPGNPGLLTLMSLDGACFSVRANGRVGIFNHDPSVALEIGTAGSNEQVKVNGTIVLGSDERVKDNIKDITNSIDKIKQLRSVAYTFKEQTATEVTNNNFKMPGDSIVKPKFVNKQKKENLSRNHYGFLAQEVEKVFPELVYKDSAGMLGVDYIGMIPLVIDALKDQKTLIDAQSKQIDAQAKQIQALIDTIEKKK
jgi:hypothetical protein